LKIVKSELSLTDSETLKIFKYKYLGPETLLLEGIVTKSFRIQFYTYNKKS